MGKSKNQKKKEQIKSTNDKIRQEIEEEEFRSLVTDFDIHKFADWCMIQEGHTVNYMWSYTAGYVDEGIVAYENYNPDYGSCGSCGYVESEDITTTEGVEVEVQIDYDTGDQITPARYIIPWSVAWKYVRESQSELKTLYEEHYDSLEKLWDFEEDMTAWYLKLLPKYY